ncbi:MULTISPECIES: N-acetylneuraminate synthase family protein [unclassified Microbacterium]|uniref:N-acetylneuraminate synthase family protein n=1 Tax=unclassified Microbacterium TaxID=2609290 RepID=UPI000EA9A30A|nr:MULTISPECIES: N-acetylneuraminate synthase family protein [unclassified Microbacterium]MBT2485382.1 N-acetylneuraminate synthase family protein [Microbacterium sp. ISL-108]RKN68185.1 N-acetylneuraminate synthase [Microbacterium sp. CGR2]
MTEGVFVIAEAGVNHNGSLATAKELIDLAASAGADAVKFQTFSADNLALESAALADYQRTSDEDSRSQHDLLRQLELSQDEFRELRDRCDAQGIQFLSTAFDVAGLDFLVSELGIPMVKIASGDLTFAPLLVAAGRTGLPVILSTGMAEMPEIERALRFIAAGVAQAKGSLERGSRLTDDVLDQTWQARHEHLDFAQHVTILHCTTEYPAADEHLNLRAMQTIASTFGHRVGYSDHSLGSLASVLAVGLGAAVVEKHFTFDVDAEGPDHAASLDPDGLRDYVAALRRVPVLLGSEEKRCQPVEEGNRAVVRRSLVVTADIAEGQIVAESDLACFRPASGRTSFDFWDVVGAPATRAYRRGDLIYRSPEGEES